MEMPDAVKWRLPIVVGESWPEGDEAGAGEVLGSAEQEAGAMTIETPACFRHHDSPFRLDRTADGGLTGHVLDRTTGRFVEDNVEIDDVLFAREGDIGSLTEEQFVIRTEDLRWEYLRGGGPIFALYDTISAMHSVAREEGRPLSRPEAALKVSLYRRTFRMWEDEFARRDAGEPPAFSYTSTSAR
jgi:hypothetical protein